MSVFQCTKCFKWVDNLMHACVPLPKGEFPAWQCLVCKEVCNCSIAEHDEVCDGEALLLNEEAPGVTEDNPVITLPTKEEPYKTYILGTEAQFSVPLASVKIKNIEAPADSDKPNKPEWKTMAYDAGPEATPETPGVVACKIIKDGTGITQELTFEDGSKQTKWLNLQSATKVPTLAPFLINSKPFLIKSNGGEFDKSEVLKGNLEPDGSGGWRRKPRVRPAFDLTKKKREHWVWMVEVRRMQRAVVGGPEPMDLWGDFTKERRHAPYGFGGKASALRRMMQLMEREAHNVASGIAEFRVVPHYIGYVPDDEDWYRVAWPEPKKSTE